MSIRDASFLNPFKNWPFPGAPLKSGLHPACSCPTDIDGNPLSPHGHECEDGFMHGYPLGLGTAPPREIPSVKVPRPEDESTAKPAGRQTAIDSLRANSLKLKAGQLRQKFDVQRENASDQPEPPKSSVSGAVSHATNYKENEHKGKMSIQPGPSTAPENSRTHLRTAMNPAGSRSVSNSTTTSFNPGTEYSWKQNSLASSSQTTLNSFDQPQQKEPKGKEKLAVWNYDSPESTSVVVGSATEPRIVASGSGSYKQTQEAHLRGDRAAHSTATTGFGKMVLGCSHCLFEPKLRVTPCGCLICLECGGRFWGSLCTEGEVFCGCGERVVSMINLAEVPLMSYPAIPSLNSAVHGLYTPITTVYSPSIGASPASSNQAQFSSPTPSSRMASQAIKLDTPVFVSPPAVSAAPFAGNPVASVNTLNMSRMLTMDAETAVKHAPFVDLGRTALAQNWSCVKIGNIPYNVTSEELLDFLGRNSNIVPEAAGSIGIHVIMDRSTGKTMDAYVEFMNARDAWKCVSRRRSRVLGNRHLSLDVVDPSELMKDIFPRAKGIVWDGVIPNPALNKPEYVSKTEIISREELVLIVNHARTPHRSPFSRKCLQRPFQSLMSIVSKFPWFAVNLYTIQQRDYIYQALYSAIDILKRQIKRGRTMPNLDIELLKALLRVGIRCAGFTDAQKHELVKIAEFGAEGIRVDADIGILSGFEALGKAIGAERKVLEFYALLLELSVSPHLSEASSQNQAAAELIRAKNVSKPHPEESKKAHLTMAEASVVEWSIVEKAIRTVLPSKAAYARTTSKATVTVSREKQSSK